MRDYDSIVIGSGAGGLAAALCLARAGERVLVLEQHYLPGGWCHSFSLEGHVFSPGVHYIGELEGDGLMRRLYEGLGVSDDLCFLELNPDGYDHVLVGEERFDIPKGRELYAERLKARFPREARGIDGYLGTVSRMAGELGQLFAFRGSLGELLSLPFRTPTLARNGLSTLDSLLGRHVQDPLLKAILSIQCGDHGEPPSRASAALHSGVVAHYFDGAYYPRGGGRSIPRAFVRALRRAGGELRVRAGVERILLEGSGRNARAVGVRLEDGSELSAGRVISNADPGITFGRLVDPDILGWGSRRRLRKTRWSVSALSLFFAVDVDPRTLGLDSGNFWYSQTPDIEGNYEWAEGEVDAEQGEFPALFLTATTLKDPSKRTPEGHHTLEAFTFVSHDSFVRWRQSLYGARPADYEELKERLTARMLRSLERIAPGISRRVVFRSLGTPLTNQHYVAATAGNLYGTAKTRSRIGPFAWPVRSDIRDLWMCGSSTVGHGVAGATVSGLMTAKGILRCSLDELLTAEGPELRILPAEDPQSWLKPTPARPSHSPVEV